MLYIIGGAARSGKSILTHRLLEEKLIPYFPLDGLVGMLKHSAPELGVTHDIPFIEKSKRAGTFNKHLFKYLLKTQKDYSAEGDCILPSDVAEVQEKYADRIRCCFLGYCTIPAEKKLEHVRTFNRGEWDWTHYHEDKEMLPMLEEMITYSKFLKEECAKYDIPFFDVSENFEGVHEEAFEFLTN